MSDFIELIKTIGLPMAIGITLSVLIGRYIIENKVNKLISKERLESEKKLENFKSELEKERIKINQEFAIELEKIKNELNSNFGNKEYRTISIFAKKIFAFDDMVAYYFNKDSIWEHIFTEKEPMFLEKVNSDLQEIWQFYHDNKMYFSNELESKTLKILNFLNFYGGGLNGFKETYKNFKKASREEKQNLYNIWVNNELKDYNQNRLNELKEFKSYFDKYDN